jgi:hypothetical protein
VRKTTREICKVLFGVGLVIVFVFTLANNEIAQSCIEAPSGLVSWWPGDGDFNDIVDANIGTNAGATMFATGKVGQAFCLTVLRTASSHCRIRRTCYRLAIN